MTARVGVPLVEGITQYMDGEYSSAVQTLAPIMSELQGSIQGSRAQKDIYAQILLHAAARSGIEILEHIFYYRGVIGVTYPNKEKCKNKFLALRADNLTQSTLTK